MVAEESQFHGIDNIFRPKIHRYLSRLVGEPDAEDLTQEVLLKVSQSLKTFRGDSQLSTWIYRIATNAALDRLRSPSFHRSVGGRLSEDSNEQGGQVDDRNVWTGVKTPSPEQQVVREEMNACISDLVGALPENYRIVLVLADLEGLTNNEIAETLGLKLDVVKIRLHRARARLRKAIETECVPEEWLPEEWR